MQAFALLTALALAAFAAEAAAAPSAIGSNWGEATGLGACALSAPALAFPSSAPNSATGPGALVWLASAHGCAPQGALELGVAPLDLRIQAQRPRTARLGVDAPAGGAPPVAVGAGSGEVAVLAPGPGGGHQVLVGRAGGRFGRELQLPGGGPAALARAYLGDVAAAAASGGRIRLALRRYLRHGFRPRVAFGVGDAPVTALALALDYRSEVLVAWEQSGTVYARLMRNWGGLGPVERIGPSAPRPAMQAMLSDNGHAMVAWATGADGGRTTAVRIALSDAHAHFDAPRSIGGFADPGGLARRPASLGLVRLAGENVLLAWTAREGGRYRVLAAPAVFAGVRPSTALSRAGEDATLEALAPGPANEVLAAWQAGDGATRVCSVVIGAGDRVLPCAVQHLPSVRSAAPPAAAVDPGGDRPVLAWLDGTSKISYITGSPLRDYQAHGYAPPAGVGRPGNGVHWLRIAAAVVAAAAACAAILLLARRRRRTRPG